VRSLAALLPALLAWSSARAGADEGVIALTWKRASTAASCIDEAAVARAVEERMGRPVFTPAGKASLLINGGVEHDPAHGDWRATLSLSDAAGAPLGRRQLSMVGPGCGPLGEAVVLAIALMIRDRQAAVTVPTRAPTTTAPGTDQPAIVASPPPAPAPRSWETTADATAMLSAGLLPKPSPALRLRGVLRPDHAPAIEIEAAAALPSEARFAPQAGTRFFGVWVGGALCPLEWSPQPWRARLCGGGWLGALFARPFGTDVTAVQRRPLLVGRVSAAVERTLGQAWFAVADLGLLIPAFRQRFEIHDDRGAHTLFEMTPVSVGAALGVGRRF
jgi:hypothetical protein